MNPIDVTHEVTTEIVPLYLLLKCHRKTEQLIPLPIFFKNQAVCKLTILSKLFWLVSSNSQQAIWNKVSNKEGFAQTTAGKQKSLDKVSSFPGIKSF